MMSVNWKIPKTKARIFLWEITEPEDELLAIIGGGKGCRAENAGGEDCPEETISDDHSEKSVKSDLEEEMRKIRSIRSEELRKQKLSVLATIREWVGKNCCLRHYEDGRPYLEGDTGYYPEGSTVHISVTHTKGHSAIIINPMGECGIDMEHRGRDFSVVEKKILSDKEIADFEDAMQEIPVKENPRFYDMDRNMMLGIYWCAKEAVYKRVGEEIVDFAEQIEIEKFSDKSCDLAATFIYNSGETQKFSLRYTYFSDIIIVWTED